MQLLLIEAMQDVCLIPSRVTRTVERRQRSSTAGARVVAGDEMGRPRRASALQKHAELDALVALHARVRRDPLRVALLEVAHDVALEILLEVPDVMREVELGCDAPRVINRVDRAATTVPDGFAVAPPHRQGDPEGVQTGCRHASRSDAGVHSTRHRHGDHR